MKGNWKIIVLVVIIIFSWLLFPFLTYGEANIWSTLPLIILAIQVIVSVLSKKRKVLWLTLINPVIFLALLYTIKPITNYVSGTPTKIHCCYHPSDTNLDAGGLVYVECLDDDCDWDGYYYYTIKINNIVTDGLINVFGSPIKAKINKSSRGR